jgi:RNA recognition motif-containing protein
LTSDDFTILILFVETSAKSLKDAYKNHHQTQMSGKRVIYVTPFDQRVTEDTLMQTFGVFGIITAINLPMIEDYASTIPKHNRNTTETQPNKPIEHKGYALIEYLDPEDAGHAVFNMNQSEYFGQILSVSIHNPKANQPGNFGMNQPNASQSSSVDLTRSIWGQVQQEEESITSQQQTA